MIVFFFFSNRIQIFNKFDMNLIFTVDLNWQTTNQKSVNFCFKRSKCFKQFAFSKHWSVLFVKKIHTCTCYDIKQKHYRFKFHFWLFSVPNNCSIELCETLFRTWPHVDTFKKKKKKQHEWICELWYKCNILSACKCSVLYYTCYLHESQPFKLLCV